MDRERERRSERGRKKERERAFGCPWTIDSVSRDFSPRYLTGTAIVYDYKVVRDEVSYIIISLLLIFLDDVNSVLI